MSWRDLKPLDDWYELERPDVTQPGGLNATEVRVVFTDPESKDWFAEWLRSKRSWTAFMAWVDEKR